MLNNTQMRKLKINQLLKSVSGITPAFGNFLWETAVYSLTKMGHSSGTVLNVLGN